MSSESSRLLTVGEIARRTGSSIHKIAYVIRSRKIEPVGRAGIARVYSEGDVERIAAELAGIEAKRTAGGAK
ncbi:MAG TPA: hypothetical protein VGZ22_21150 [Isosphaeraceae bacterium]|nr:hypothetical protein [Isosphaeraceae bacterium]